MKRISILMLGLIIIFVSASNVYAKKRKKSHSTKYLTTIKIPSYKVFCDVYDMAVENPEKWNKIGLSVLYEHNEPQSEDGAFPEGDIVCIGKDVRIIIGNDYTVVGPNLEYKAAGHHAFLYEEYWFGLRYRAYYFINKRDRDIFFRQMLEERDIFHDLSLEKSEDGWYIIRQF